MLLGVKVGDAESLTTPVGELEAEGATVKVALPVALEEGNAE